MGVTEILCSFRWVLEEKTGKELYESSRLEFLEKFLANIFALSDTECNTPTPMKTEGIADLTLLRTLLAICQKSQVSSFWEVIDSFVLLAYASLAASRTVVTNTSLPELSFRLRRFNLLVQLSMWFLWTIAAENHADE